MKKHFLNVSLWTFLSLALSVTTIGCSKDSDYPDVDGQEPTMEFLSEHIQTAAGRSISIKGNLTDNDGIASVTLQCKDLNLNKTIDLIEIYGEPKTSYDLDYKFQIQKDEIGESFTIIVTTIDVGGRSVSREVLVTMDGDFENPVFTIAPGDEVTVLLKSETKFKLNLKVSDDKALDYVTVNIPSVSGYEPKRIEANGQKEFEYKDNIVLPSVLNVYEVVLTAVDKNGNSTTKTSTLTVSELQDFEKMYLADVATVEELNSDIFGVPMRINHTGEYEYEAEYYNLKAGTEIFFLPQKTDFAPICFGLDPDDTTKLTDDPEIAKPIVLETANVYYKVKFNTMKSTYSISTLAISDAKNNLPQAIGSDYYLDKSQPQYIVPFQIGVLGNLPGCSGNPSGLLMLNPDETNPNLFSSDNVYLDVVTEKGEPYVLNFIIHNKHDWGWWDYCLWRVDNETDPEIFLYGGADAASKPKDIWGKPAVKKEGTYKFWFDAHLERGKLVPVK